MGKRSKLCSNIKEFKGKEKKVKKQKYETGNETFETKSQLFEEPPQNEVNSNNKKHTNSNDSLKYKLILEENVKVEEAEAEQLSHHVKKIRTSKKNKTSANKDDDKTNINNIFKKNVVAVNCENIEVEDAEPVQSPHDKKVKTGKKNKKRANKDNVETSRSILEENFVAVESDAKDLLTDLPNNKIKTKKKNNSKLTKVTKIIFTDDKPIEVNNQTMKPRKVKNTELPKEDDVKDEDIDMFCEELSEEDNVQYNNWVELIEAKLNSNKKKSK